MSGLRILLVCLFFFGISCGVQKDVLMKVNYTDQNNNQYLITETTFNYIPITEKESSSGTYNGGKSISKPITSENFNELLQLAEALVATSPKDVKREMMTSVLSVSRNGTSERVTLRKSIKRNELEAMLVNIKNAAE